jgi:hypothetical protein
VTLAVPHPAASAPATSSGNDSDRACQARRAIQAIGAIGAIEDIGVIGVLI